MARAKVSPEDLRKIRELAAEWGKIVTRRAGDAAAELDFQAIELMVRFRTGAVSGSAG